MSLLAYRDAVTAAIKAAFPDWDVSSFGGRFTIESLKAFSVRAPALRIAVLSTAKVGRRADGRKEVPVTVAVFVVTKDKPSLTRDAAVLKAVDDLIDLVDGKQFLPAPQQFSAHLANVSGVQNLHDADTQGLAVALWALSFTQTVVIGRAESEFDDVYPLGDDIDEAFPLERISATSVDGTEHVFGDDE